jgi:hypothetical protein
MGWADWIGALIGFVLTLLIFSYLIGDNPLFRITLHLFIGVSAGFASTVVIYNVLLPRMFEPLIFGQGTEQILALVPIILAGLLVSKISPRFAFLGNLPMAYIVGVSAAAAIGGAVLGTLIPQTMASMNLLDVQAIQEFDENLGLRMINGIIILIGTLTTLAYFQFSSFSGITEKTQLQTWLEALGQIGQVFVAITFGFLFAGVFNAALTALIGRVVFVIDFFKAIIDLFIN